MIIISFIYTALLKTEFTKCFDSQANAGNSGRQYYGTSTQQWSQTQGSLVQGDSKQEGRTENVKNTKNQYES